MFARLAEDVDALALCGDLVDYGLPAEAEILLEELNPILRKKIPTLAVFGNHEFESGKADQGQKILTTGGITCSTVAPVRSTASASPASRGSPVDSVSACSSLGVSLSSSDSFEKR
jgi:predicted MPP superfamily phosphohydrolase